MWEIVLSQLFVFLWWLAQNSGVISGFSQIPIFASGSRQMLICLVWFGQFICLTRVILASSCIESKP
jgi:hypothetical protein